MEVPAVSPGINPWNTMTPYPRFPSPAGPRGPSMISLPSLGVPSYRAAGIRWPLPGEPRISPVPRWDFSLPVRRTGMGAPGGLSRAASGCPSPGRWRLPDAGMYYPWAAWEVLAPVPGRNRHHCPLRIGGYTLGPPGTVGGTTRGVPGYYRYCWYSMGMGPMGVSPSLVPAPIPVPLPYGPLLQATVIHRR